MFGFGVKKNNSLGLVYDIGSDSIGGALVLFRKKEKPKIIYTTRMELPIPEYPRSEKFKNDTLEGIRQVSKKLNEDGMPHLKFTPHARLHPHYAYCMLAAPWHVSQTRTIKMEKEKPFSISRVLIKELTDSEVEAFTTDPDVSKELAGFDPAIIEQQIMEVRLNGYETNKPYGKFATSLKAELLMSVTPEEIMEDITAAIRSSFAIRDVSLGSFPVAFFQIMRNLKHTPKDFLLCDVNGEFTELSLVEDDVLAQTATAPAGKRTLLRKMAEATDSFPDEILSRLQTAQEQDTYAPDIAEAQKEAERVWVDALRTALNKLSPSSVLPRTVYLTADPEIEQWCKDILGREPTVINFSGAPLETTIISTSFASAQCDFSEHVRHDDVFFALGALYAKMTHGA